MPGGEVACEQHPPGDDPGNDIDATSLSPGHNAGQLKLIMKHGVAPDSMKPGFQRARATSNRGFMSFRRLRDTPVVVLARSV